VTVATNVALVTTLAFCVVGPVGAQQTRPADAAASLCDRARLQPGMLVRVHDKPNTIIGPVIECSPEALQVGPHMGRDDSLTIPIKSVDLLWVRGDNKKLGLFIGLGVGAVAGYFWNGVDASLCSSTTTPGPGNCAANRMVGAAIGAAVGGVIGYVIGAATPHWVRRIPG